MEIVLDTSKHFDLLIDWCFTPTLAVFHLYPGMGTPFVYETIII